MSVALNDLVRTVRRSAEADRLAAASDDALLDRLHPTWDAVAFEALVRRHARSVSAACRSVLRDDADVNDAVQATFLVLLRNAGTVRRGSPLGRWLYGVARKVSLKAKARAVAVGKREAKAARGEQQSSADPGWRETCDLLLRELARLPAAVRRPLELCYLDGLTRDEAAAALGISVGTVKGRLERGRAVLRERLEKRGVALSVGLLALALMNTAAAVSPRVVSAVLSAASGSAPPTVAALAEGITVSGSSKVLSLLAVFAAGALGVGGWAASNVSAGPDDKPAMTKPAAEMPGPNAQKPNEMRNERTITGTVVGHDDKPVQADLVFVPRGGEPKPLGRANAKGEFAVRLPVGVDGTLAAVADGHGVTGAGVWSKMPTELAFRLPKGFVVRGRVLDLQGKAVAGATVTPLRVTAAGAERVDGFLTTWAKMAPQEDAFGQSRGDSDFGPHPGFTLRGKRVLSAATDADGKFELAGLGAEQVAELLVRGPGVADTPFLVVTRADVDVDAVNTAAMKARATYMLAEPGPLPSAARLHGPTPALAVEPEKPIRGVVTDAATGEPRAGVPVTFGRLTEKGFILPRPHTAVTDKDGKFVLRGSRRYESYLIETAADPKGGYRAAKAEAKDTAGLEPVEVKLLTPRNDETAKPTAVGGTVTGPDGKPVAGAAVSVVYGHHDQRAAVATVAVTDAAGTFRGDVPKEVPAHFTVFATKPGFGVAWVEPKYPARTIADADKLSLALTADQPIRGRVLDTQGKPVAGAVVGVLDVIEPLNADLDKLLKGSADGGFGTSGQWEKVLWVPREVAGATTDRDGRFEVAGLGADRVVGLTVSGNGLARMSGMVVTRTGVDVEPLNRQPAGSMQKGKGRHAVFYVPTPTFVVEPGYAVQGVVTAAKTGKPIAGCRLEVNTGHWDRIHTTTDAAGKYRFDGLTKGMGHYIHATPPKGADVFPTWADVKEGKGFEAATLDFALVAGAVFTGRVIDKETKQPVAASFQIIPSADNEFAKQPEYETASRDMVWKGGAADGQFRIVTVPGKSVVEISVVPTGTLHDQPFHPYRGGQKLEIDLPVTGGKEHVIEIDRGKTAAANAVDEAGKPVAGPVVAGVTKTNQDGVEQSRVFKLPAAESKFTVYGLGEKERRRVVAIQPAKKLGGSLLVEPGGTSELKMRPLLPVRGTFTDPDGTPLAGLTVTIEYDGDGLWSLFRDHAPKWVMTATTDKDGKFEIPDVIPNLLFTFGVRKGDTSYRGTPRIGTRFVPVGKPLELGVRKLEIAD